MALTTRRVDMGGRVAVDAMTVPIWPRAISARGTVKASLGSVTLPAVCSGVGATAGDVVVTDDGRAEKGLPYIDGPPD